VIQARVEGLTELKDLLERKLPEHIQGKAMQGALAQAAKPIVTEARKNAPVKTGILRRAIYSLKARESTRQKAIRLITVRAGKRQGKRDAYYWKWIEFGRGASTAKKGSLGTPERGFFGKTVKATLAQPFLRPAFESQKMRAIDVFKATMVSEIEKVSAKYGKSLRRRINRKVFGA
jgi:HK97 gp10 family phage protein